MSNPKVYIGTKDAAPVVMLTTENHKAFSKETLIQALYQAEAKCKEIVAGWDPKNWFPCGFANLWVEDTSPLVRLIKKEGTINPRCTSFTDALGLSMNKAYDGGYSIHWDNIPITGTLGQCMHLKAQCYGVLVEELAYLSIRASVLTMVD